MQARNVEIKGVEFYDLIFYDLPKLSLNKWYSGSHWSERKKIKDDYHYIIKDKLKQTNFKFDDKSSYIVNYNFEFKGSPLDASNCAAMVKLIEDVLFENDSYKIIDTIQITSRKSKEKQNKVYIEIIKI